jgi:ubiquinone/menaquinone biosynthesis C-methylase UbiE
MTLPAATPTERFSNRVENYVRYRPPYPTGVLDILRDKIGLNQGTVIADVGSGTGISTGLFLRNGNPVFAIEPNRKMRAAAEKLLSGFPGFHSVNGTAEATTLPDGLVDCVVAAQAFHWFDPVKAHAEFRRILTQDGWVVLLWNTRLKQTTPFQRAYERLLETYAVDYAGVQHERINAAALSSFYAAGFQVRSLPNTQTFDWESLKGRLLSSSYTPTEGQKSYAPMINALRDIFQENQQGGQVQFDYETNIYFGRI